MEKINSYMLELELLNSNNDDTNNSLKFEFFRKVVFKFLIQFEF
jgi:hypothetical protein